MKTSVLASLGGEHQAHPVSEQTEVAAPGVRTVGQQMNGIIGDRSSVSSADMLVRSVNRSKMCVLYIYFRLIKTFLPQGPVTTMSC